MNAQSNSTDRRIAAGEALRLGRLGGELAVIEGRVWLTRDGDLADHVIEPGQRWRLGVDENAVIESARADETVTVRWYPRRQSVFGALSAAPLRGMARLASLAAGGFAGLARNMAASASRAQGCIVAGDGLTSSGPLK